MLLQTDTIVLEHSRYTDFIRVTYETACRGSRIEIVYRTNPRGDAISRIAKFTVDGRKVLGAADTLRIRAAGRSIDKMEIMNCGFDGPQPVITGSMTLASGWGPTAQFPRTTFFSLTPNGKRWRLSALPMGAAGKDQGTTETNKGRRRR